MSRELDPWAKLRETWAKAVGDSRLDQLKHLEALGRQEFVDTVVNSSPADVDVFRPDEQRPGVRRAVRTVGAGAMTRRTWSDLMDDLAYNEMIGSPRTGMAIISDETVPCPSVDTLRRMRTHGRVPLLGNSLLPPDADEKFVKALGATLDKWKTLARVNGVRIKAIKLSGAEVAALHRAGVVYSADHDSSMHFEGVPVVMKYIQFFNDLLRPISPPDLL